jgi:hypothetical protein
MRHANKYKREASAFGEQTQRGQNKKHAYVDNEDHVDVRLHKKWCCGARKHAETNDIENKCVQFVSTAFFVHSLFIFVVLQNMLQFSIGFVHN